MHARTGMICQLSHLGRVLASRVFLCPPPTRPPTPAAPGRTARSCLSARMSSRIFWSSIFTTRSLARATGLHCPWLSPSVSVVMMRQTAHRLWAADCDSRPRAVPTSRRHPACTPSQCEVPSASRTTGHEWVTWCTCSHLVA